MIMRCSSLACVLFVASCGGSTPPPVGPSSQPAPAATVDAAAAAKQMFELVNKDRVANGQPAVVWDDKAAAVAVHRSEEMRDKAKDPNAPQSTATAAERAKAGGVLSPLIVENLGHTTSVADAEDGFMHSPGHRDRILSPLVTHLGVGVVVEGNELYTTQLFWRLTPVLEPTEAKKKCMEALTKARTGLPTLAPDNGLDAIAQRAAVGLAAGKPRNAIDKASDADLKKLAKKFKTVQTVVAVAGDPSEAIADAVKDPSPKVVGLGVAQGANSELGDNIFYVVTFLATPR
jgi:uncharacterized protein YkwD